MRLLANALPGANIHAPLGDAVIDLLWTESATSSLKRLGADR